MQSSTFAVENVPHELRSVNNWLCWKAEIRDGKPAKVPYRAATGTRASVTNPDHLCSFDVAVAALRVPENGYAGVGFVFSAEDGFAGVDIDNCVLADGTVEPWARQIIDELDSYSEISPSGTGVKVFLLGTLEGRKRRRKGSIEMYDGARFFTVTANRLAGTPESVMPRQEQLDALYERTFPPKPAAARSGAASSSAPPPAKASRLNDDEVLGLCRKAGNRDKFSRLWAGDTSEYSHQGNDGDSEADLALCSVLAFYTGPDPEQIDRLFRRSALCREKWIDREDYRQRTIDRALEGKSEFYKPPTGNRNPPSAGMVEPNPREEVNEREGGGTIADELLRLAEANGLELFHTPGGEPSPFVSFTVNAHTETWRLRHSRFKSWLRGLYYRATGRAVNDAAMDSAMDVLESKAIFDGPALPIFVRVGSIEHNGQSKMYLDLGSPDWSVIELDEAGWRLLAQSPVKFRRTRATMAIPLPKRGGSIDLLRPFINTPDEDAFKLMVGFLLGCFMPHGAYPILVLTGEAGSAKSTAAEMLRALIDPSNPPFRSRPKSEHDLFIAAANSRLLIFDNLSSISDDLSDSLCKLATGGGFGARKLYSDDDEVLLDVACPVIVTGIDELTDREDFLSRAVRVVLPNIPKCKRTPERTLWARFDAKAPLIFGAILDAVSKALAGRDGVADTLIGLSRMADLCVWVTAAEQSLGWESGSFMRSFERLQEDAAEVALEASPFGRAVVGLMGGRPEWWGTATELLRASIPFAGLDEVGRRPLGWPKSSNTVVGALRRVGAGLRRRGIVFDQERESDAGRARIIVLRRDESGTVRSVRTVQGSGRPMTDSGPRRIKLSFRSSGVVRAASPPVERGRTESPTGSALDDPDGSDDPHPESTSAPSDMKP